MYGIVNKAIEDMTIAAHGEAAWNAIKQKSGVRVDYFMSHEPYNDDITYQLAIAAADHLAVPLKEVLTSFGEYWVLQTGREKYGALLAASGANLKDFLLNLPLLHNRLMLIFPKLSPPEFKVTDVEDTSLHIHYYSHRPGLQDFVIGLLQGLGKMFHAPVVVTQLRAKGVDDDHDVFCVKW